MVNLNSNWWREITCHTFSWEISSLQNSLRRETRIPLQKVKIRNQPLHVLCWSRCFQKVTRKIWLKTLENSCNVDHLNNWFLYKYFFKDLWNRYRKSNSSKYLPVKKKSKKVLLKNAYVDFLLYFFSAQSE